MHLRYRSKRPSSSVSNISNKTMNKVGLSFINSVMLACPASFFKNDSRQAGMMNNDVSLLKSLEKRQITKIILVYDL